MDDKTLRVFADALADPCLILDRRSVIVHRNKAAIEQFPSVATGNPIALSLRNPPLLTAIDAARRTGEPQTIELHQTVPNETWHKVTVSPLSRPSGPDSPSPPLVVTMQNLTEAKRIDALRADFIANASHELRTPLASLIGFIVVYAVVFSVGALYILRLMAEGPQAGSHEPVRGGAPGTPLAAAPDQPEDGPEERP